MTWFDRQRQRAREHEARERAIVHERRRVAVAMWIAVQLERREEIRRLLLWLVELSDWRMRRPEALD